MRRATAKHLSLWLVLGSLCCSAFVNADSEHQAPGAIVSNTDQPENLTLENAYRIQLMEKRARESQGSEVVGYKAELTSHTAQQRFDVAAPVSGILYADMAAPGRELPLADFSQPMLEVELGFILARLVECESALDLRMSTLIAEVVPVIEIPDLSAVSPLTGPAIVAANVAARGYLIGPALPWKDRETLSRVRVELIHGGDSLFRGAAVDAMSDQYSALRWLLEHRLRQNDKLAGGHLLITGALGQMVPAAAGQNWARYGLATSDEQVDFITELTFTVLR